MTSRKWMFAVAGCVVLALGLAACGGDDDDDDSGSAGTTPEGLSGEITIDGSSTVGPLTERIAEDFQTANPDVRVSVGTSGTSGGFEKFCAGETDANDASRAIEAPEKKACQEGGVEYEEVQVANDALSVVVNPDNPVTCMTVEQLSSVWDKGSTIDSWDQIKNLDADYSESLDLYGPGTDSGTFDYFTEAINGEEGVQRTDYNNVGEDDNATVTGVPGSPGRDGLLRLLVLRGEPGHDQGARDRRRRRLRRAIRGDGPGRDLQPLGRPLFIYPSSEALQDETVQAFIAYYVDNVNDVATQIGFIPMTDEQLSQSQDEVAKLGGG